MKSVLYFLASVGFLCLLNLFFAFGEWLISISWLTPYLVVGAFAFMGGLLWLSVKCLRGDFVE